MNNTISSFTEEYFSLSNFYSAPVTYQGYHFKNNEAAFQTAKCPARMNEFCELDPDPAKHFGRKVSLRPDWESVKYEVMYQICYAKFTQNPDLRKKLIDTGSRNAC